MWLQGDIAIVSLFGLQHVVTIYNWDSVADELAMLQLIRNGTAAALLIDAPFADYYTARSCDLYEVRSIQAPGGGGRCPPAAGHLYARQAQSLGIMQGSVPKHSWVASLTAPLKQAAWATSAAPHVPSGVAQPKLAPVQLVDCTGHTIA